MADRSYRLSEAGEVDAPRSRARVSRRLSVLPLMRLPKTNRRLVVVGFLVVAALTLATAWLILAQRAADLIAIRQANGDLAQVVLEHTTRTITQEAMELPERD